MILYQKPNVTNQLDPAFYPVSLGNHFFRHALITAKDIEHIILAIEDRQGGIVRFETDVFGKREDRDQENMIYLERLIKTMLWTYGGYKVYLGMPKRLAEPIQAMYKIDGLRSFDVRFMTRIYERPLEFIMIDPTDVPQAQHHGKPLGRHLDGCRIGFDAGGSDRKVSAVKDGKVIYSEEVIWYPKLQTDPSYHYEGIMDSLKRAASYLPKVDAIGISSAGVYIDNKIMAASLFINIPEHLFDTHVKTMYLDIGKTFGDIPIEVANDGDVTALAGSMNLGKNKVLGIAMGTSEASGYIDDMGHLTGWLNELAFVPVDYNPGQTPDPWSGDHGCGTNYFSQDAVIRLAGLGGIPLDDDQSPAEKLKSVQELLAENDSRAISVYEMMGVYLGYGIAYYHEFYAFDHVLLLGRVTSGSGGQLMLEWAKKVLKHEFPSLYDEIEIHLPDEKNRRVGQSIAAASLPKIHQ